MLRASAFSTRTPSSSSTFSAVSCSASMHSIALALVRLAIGAIGFQEAIARGTTSLVDNGVMIKRMAFRPGILVAQAAFADKANGSLVRDADGTVSKKHGGFRLQRSPFSISLAQVFCVLPQGLHISLDFRELGVWFHQPHVLWLYRLLCFRFSLLHLHARAVSRWRRGREVSAQNWTIEHEVSEDDLIDSGASETSVGVRLHPALDRGGRSFQGLSNGWTAVVSCLHHLHELKNLVCGRG